MNKTYKKIGFNIYFEPFDWFIGTGEYFVDFEDMVKKDVLEYISKLVPNKNNYFFILDYDKKTLFHVIDDLINKPARNVTNLENRGSLGLRGGRFITLGSFTSKASGKANAIAATKLIHNS